MLVEMGVCEPGPQVTVKSPCLWNITFGQSQYLVGMCQVFLFSFNLRTIFSYDSQIYLPELICIFKSWSYC